MAQLTHDKVPAKGDEVPLTDLVPSVTTKLNGVARPLFGVQVKFALPLLSAPDRVHNAHVDHDHTEIATPAHSAGLFATPFTDVIHHVFAAVPETTVIIKSVLIPHTAPLNDALIVSGLPGHPATVAHQAGVTLYQEYDNQTKVSVTSTVHEKPRVLASGGKVAPLAIRFT